MMNTKQKTKQRTTAYIKTLFLFILIGFFSGSLFTVSAQISGPGQSLSVTVVPQTPAPGEEITITAQSFVTDLNRAMIQWMRDGVKIIDKRGEKTFRFTNGSLGEKTTVVLIVNTVEGVRIEKKFDFQPAIVNLVWEAGTYTPPFYKGKALATPESILTIVALPQFSANGQTLLNPEDLVYTWSKNHRILGNKSGFGKRSITIRSDSIFQNTSISVMVSSFDTSLSAKNNISVGASEAEILFYEKHALLGTLYRKALTKTFSLTDEEVIIRAEPYFFSKEDLSSELDFKWSLNNRTITTNDPQQEIVLRQTETPGIARLKLQISNINKLLQYTNRILSLQFGLGSEFRF